MKKVKLMLLSFCVLAIVAGALAFKSKGSTQFCYAEPDASSPFCGTILSPKSCPNHTTIGRSHSTRNLCTAATNGAATGDKCSGVNCGTESVLSTTSEN